MGSLAAIPNHLRDWGLLEKPCTDPSHEPYWTPGLDSDGCAACRGRYIRFTPEPRTSKARNTRKREEPQQDDRDLFQVESEVDD